MNIVFYTILVVSAIITIVFDYKIQKIPWYILVINYSSICMLISPWLLLGNIFIFIVKKLDRSIDFIYVIILLFIMLINPFKLFNFIAIGIVLLYTLLTKDEKISFMVPISINLILLIGIILFKQHTLII